MSDVVAELRLENHRLLKRIVQIQVYLDNTERELFSKSEIWKMLEHVKKGGGWI